MPDLQQNLLKKLQYRSAHRGCKETDLIMERFAQKYIPTLSAEELGLYAAFLDEDDAYIWDWLIQPESVPEQYSGIIEKLRLCTPITE